MKNYIITYQKYKQLIPVLVLIVCCILTIISSFYGSVEVGGESYDFELTVKHYGAFLAVAIILVSFFIFRRYFKYIFALMLFLGVINFISFTALQNSTYVSINGYQLSFQPILLSVMILTYLLNFNKINAILFDFITPTKEQAEKNFLRKQNEQVDKFKERFNSYTNEQLNKILKENRLIPEALQAAQQLLTERQSTQ